MNYDPRIHHRQSIRLKGYDYSRSGLFFITIDVQNKLCLFGKVVNGKMVLNEPGKMIERWYYEMENKFPDKRCHEMIVMPNHFHCILENVETYYIHLPSAHVSGTDAHVSGTDAPIWNVDAPIPKMKKKLVSIIKNMVPQLANRWIGLKQ